jgi:ribosomal protein S18 acetylase RimI-like enzyme
MSELNIREFQATDLDALIRLWNQVISGGFKPVYSLSEVVASCQKDVAVVAVTAAGEVIGIAVARAAHDQGWIVFFATDDLHRRQGIGDRLLGAIEQRLAPSGLTKLSVLVPDDQNNLGVLTRAGFLDKKHLRYFEREIPVRSTELSVLKKLGGRIQGRNLWSQIAGMSAEKELLEKRLVLPLSNVAVANQFGVEPPRAIVLFGPPGTGKTTFARAIASRLEWPFIEIFPSRLAAGSEGLASGLRETFEAIAQLDHAIVFIDEVEEIASQRGGEPPSPTQGVTNELLKLIPAFRDSPNKLLICATNFIRALDDAFLRHGRFDYVIPIGLPDDDARFAIWGKFIPLISAEHIDIATLVAKSAGFSPADIEYAARRASQSAFETAMLAGEGEPTESSGPTMDNYLTAIDQTKMTVSAEVASAFTEDITNLARV